MNLSVPNRPIAIHTPVTKTLTMQGGVVAIIHKCAALGLCVWYTLPIMVEYTAFWFVLAFIWLCTARHFGRQLLSKANVTRYVFLCLWLTVTVLYVLAYMHDAIFIGQLKATMLSLFCVEFIRYYYEREDWPFLKLLVWVTLLSYFAGAIMSINLIAADPEVLKRAVAYGAEDQSVGNFGTFYSAIFVFGCMLYLLIHQGKTLSIWLLAAGGMLVCGVMLYLGQFTISYLMLFLLLALIGLNIALKSRQSVIFTICLLVTLSFLALKQDIAYSMMNLSSTVQIAAVSDRLYDMGSYLLHGGTGHTDVRVSFYMGSIENFLRYPLTGTLSLQTMNTRVSTVPSGHNSLFELFALYGVFIASCFLYFPVTVLRKILHAWKETRYYPYLVASVTVYLVLSCINPTFNVQTLSFMMMVVVTSLPVLTMSRHQMTKTP